jgi:quercetin dioxygenase-like cupin family protein
MHDSVSRFIEFSDDGPVTRKLAETDRTIVTLVCLRPGQVIPPFTHRRREAFVYVLRGAVRISPGQGPAELRKGDLATYDGSVEASPRNAGEDDAAFLVTLVRKRGD